MDRRNFIKSSVIGVGTGLLLAELPLSHANEAALAGSVYFTKGAPGRWQGKEAGHLPAIDVVKADGKVTLNVVTAHEMKDYEHYIVKHVVLDKNYKFIAEHLFNPTKDKAAISAFSLQDYSGPVYVLSMCNKHDVWLSSAQV